MAAECTRSRWRAAEAGGAQDACVVRWMTSSHFSGAQSPSCLWVVHRRHVHGHPVARHPVDLRNGTLTEPLKGRVRSGVEAFLQVSAPFRCFTFICQGISAAPNHSTHTAGHTTCTRQRWSLDSLVLSWDVLCYPLHRLLLHCWPLQARHAAGRDVRFPPTLCTLTKTPRWQLFPLLLWVCRAAHGSWCSAAHTLGAPCGGARRPT